jgi:hypothetical protein
MEKASTSTTYIPLVVFLTTGKSLIHNPSRKRL